MTLDLIYLHLSCINKQKATDLLSAASLIVRMWPDSLNGSSPACGEVLVEMFQLAFIEYYFYYLESRLYLHMLSGIQAGRVIIPSCSQGYIDIPHM